MVRLGMRMLLEFYMLLIFAFGAIAGACIADTMERHRHNLVMVSLMGLSMKELGEIRVKKI